MGFGFTNISLLMGLVGVVHLLALIGLLIWAIVAVKGSAKAMAALGIGLILLAGIPSTVMSYLAMHFTLSLVLVGQVFGTLLDIIGLALLVAAAAKASRAAADAARRPTVAPTPGGPRPQGPGGPQDPRGPQQWRPVGQPSAGPDQGQGPWIPVDAAQRQPSAPQQPGGPANGQPQRW